MKFRQPKVRFNKKMNTYFIFKNNLKNDDYMALANGFSFYALVFGPFWGLITGLWVFSIVNLSLILFLQIFFNEFLVLLMFFSNLFWGLLGKDLHIQNLISSNYTAKSIIVASSHKKALLTYFSEQT